MNKALLDTDIYSEILNSVDLTVIGAVAVLVETEKGKRAGTPLRERARHISSEMQSQQGSRAAVEWSRTRRYDRPRALHGGCGIRPSQAFR